MSRKNWLFIVFLTGLSLLYTWYEANRPAPVSWEETYSPEDKNPYGTYIFREALPVVFPESEIRTERISLPELFPGGKSEGGDVYISICLSFRADSLAAGRLLEWVQAGNDCFIAASYVAENILNPLGLGIALCDERDTLTLIVGKGELKHYSIANTGGYFVADSLFKGTVLGYKRCDSLPDFVRIPYGEGCMWLCLNPRAFTNYVLLDSLNADYAFGALSHVPVEGGKIVNGEYDLSGSNHREIIWDAYSSMGRKGSESLLRVVLQHPPLRYALWLLLAGGLAYVLFRAKREQRPIPVVNPPQDRMLDFIRSVSLLYFRKKDHTAIAIKRLEFFLEEVRYRYHLPTEVLDEHFVRLLSEHAGTDIRETMELVKLCSVIREGTNVSEEMLERLIKQTDLFIKKMYNQNI